MPPAAAQHAVRDRAHLRTAGNEELMGPVPNLGVAPIGWALGLALVAAAPRSARGGSAPEGRVMPHSTERRTLATTDNESE